MKVDLACGQNPQLGFTGVDISGADIDHDLFTFPWPFESGSVSDVYCSHFVEHIPHWRPGWAKDGWWLFWEEVYRICEPAARVTVVHPYLKTVRAFQDPTHERFIPAETWPYLDARWRAAQRLDHYPTAVDFETTFLMSRGASVVDADGAYWDQHQDLEVRLRKR